ncbi:hypothetical protein LY76DRAFT_599940 [Colletotrichum caudatum]|nr:hypothetical protein LY76DRAFT_599940 [Colletotrichum caudatum]
MTISVSVIHSCSVSASSSEQDGEECQSFSGLAEAGNLIAACFRIRCGFVCRSKQASVREQLLEAHVWKSSSGRIWYPVTRSKREEESRQPQRIRVSIICCPAQVYADEGKSAELTALESRLVLLGPSSSSCSQKEEVKASITSATACFDFEEDAQRVREHNTMLPFVRSSTLEVVPLCTATINVPCEYPVSNFQMSVSSE